MDWGPQAQGVSNLKCASINFETNDWLDPDLPSLASWSTEYTADLSTSPHTNLMGLSPADVSRDDHFTFDVNFTVENALENNESYDIYPTSESLPDIDVENQPMSPDQSVAFDFEEGPVQPTSLDAIISTVDSKCASSFIRPAQATKHRITKSGKSSRRTQFTSGMKEKLEAYFGFNPYPNKMDLALLAEDLKLPLRATKTWFNNARSRKGKVEDTKLSQPHLVPSETGNGENPHEVTRGPSVELEALRRLSRSPSRTSLERYLAAPLAEEAITADAISSLYCSSHTSYHSNSDDVGIGARSGDHFQVPPYPHRTQSVAGSESSMSSINSIKSCASFVSIDARGSRRGRKRWVRSQNSVLAEIFVDDVWHDSQTLLQQRNNELQSAMSEARERARRFSTPRESSTGSDTRSQRTSQERFFCTWQGCEKAFHHRFEWSRHEQAVHYTPYSWVCCLDIFKTQHLYSCFLDNEFCGASHYHLKSSDFVTCASKDEEARTFFRTDQLKQHIKSAHIHDPPKSVLKDLAQCWKRDNPNFDHSTLVCGFCGQYTETWGQREGHVAQHMLSGALKSSWAHSLPEVLLEPETTCTRL